MNTTYATVVVTYAIERSEKQRNHQDGSPKPRTEQDQLRKRCVETYECGSREILGDVLGLLQEDVLTKHIDSIAVNIQNP